MHNITAEDLLAMASLLDTDPDRQTPVTLSGQDAIKAAAMLRAVAAQREKRPPSHEEVVQAIHLAIGSRSGGYTIGRLREALAAHLPSAEAPAGRWILRFEDERDFCLAASPIIGASFSAGDSAVARLNHGRIQAFGAVDALRT